LKKNATMHELLRQRYGRNGDRPVAFVDESYLAPGFIAAQNLDASSVDPFYVLTGVVVYPESFEQMRHDLLEIVGQGFFHATQYGRGAKDSAVLSRMAQYLVDGNEVALVSVRMPAVDDLDEMAHSRTLCYRGLLRELYEGTHHEPVRLIVGEERHERRLNNWDQRVLTDAKKDGVVGRDLSLMLASPSAERLLWLPDLVSNAMYRYLVGTDLTNYSILEPCLEILTVEDAAEVEDALAAP
jgi:hypothetical protein